MSYFDDVVIVGVAESELGKTSHMNSADLMAQASIRALEDAGLEKKDVDGLFSTSNHYFMPSLDLAEYLGIEPKFMGSSSMGGSSFLSHVSHAAMALANG